MLNNLSNFVFKLGVLKLGVIVLMALAFNLVATEWLNASYSSSKFPVPYFEAQLSFDHLKLKAWYSALIVMGTLSTYIQTQHIDFVFIVSVLFLHFFALLLVAKLIPKSSKWHKITLIAALLSTIAPLADALENLVSYRMLMNPLDFNSYLAIVYSSFAAIKFAFFTFAYVAAIVSLLIALLLWQKRVFDSRQKSRLV